MLSTLTLALFLSSTALAAKSLDSSRLPGHWSGSGHYYEVKLQKDLPAPHFDLRINPDLTLSGQIGDARIRPARPRAVGPRIDYYVELDGAVANSLERKKHVVILITDLGEDAFSADFHLKSRKGFDLSMHPGSLEAVRTHSRTMPAPSLPPGRNGAQGDCLQGRTADQRSGPALLRDPLTDTGAASVRDRRTGDGALVGLRAVRRR